MLSVHRRNPVEQLLAPDAANQFFRLASKFAGLLRAALAFII
jgi:hypothetical protein